jgi:hypothetical protein
MTRPVSRTIRQSRFDFLIGKRPGNAALDLFNVLDRTWGLISAQPLTLGR